MPAKQKWEHHSAVASLPPLSSGVGGSVGGSRNGTAPSLDGMGGMGMGHFALLPLHAAVGTRDLNPIHRSTTDHPPLQKKIDINAPLGFPLEEVPSSHPWH